MNHALLRLLWRNLGSPAIIKLMVHDLRRYLVGIRFVRFYNPLCIVKRAVCQPRRSYLLLLPRPGFYLSQLRITLLGGAVHPSVLAALLQATIPASVSLSPLYSLASTSRSKDLV